MGPFRLGLIISGLIILLYLVKIPFLEIMELKALDLQFITRGPKEPDRRIVLVVIDEKSLDELGRWPWSRRLIAQGLSLLNHYGAKVIGLDLVFSEPEQLSSLELKDYVLEKLGQWGLKKDDVEKLFTEWERERSGDEYLAQVIGESGRIILGYFFYIGTENPPGQALPIDQVGLPTGYSIIRYQSAKAKAYPFIEATAVERPLPLLAQSARGLGFFNIIPDQDGSIRSLPLIIRYADQLYSPFALEIVKAYLEEPHLSVEIADYGVRGIRLGKREIITDEQGRLLINYRGPSKTFPHYSYCDLIKERLAPHLFRDKIVLIGATAIGIYDLRVTPFGSVFPGIEIHANIIDNLLNQDYLIRPNWTGLLNIGAIGLTGLLLSLLLSRVKAIWGAFMTLGLFLSYLSLDRYLFLNLHYWLGLIYPALNLVAIYLGITAYNYMREEREKRRIRNAFQHYVAPSVVNEMLRHPDQLRLGGEKKRLTVLFSDIRGFTSISEQMEPETLVQFLNQYLTQMTNIIFRHEGLLDKYMGDAIMAIFGAPLAQPDHALRACLAALEMSRELKRLGMKGLNSLHSRLAMGIGINTGWMVIGNMGSERRFDYTVLGDNVNLASRLEGLNKEYKTSIIISEFTQQEVKDYLLCRELDLVRVKGKDQPVRIYEVRGRLEERSEELEWINTFHQALEHYRQQAWSEAERLFHQVLRWRPEDYPTKLYLARCRQFRQNPPGAQWDGVFSYQTK